MPDDALLAELMDAAPTFASAWRRIAEAYPATEPATLSDSLFYLESHLRSLVAKDRHGELRPLLAAVERVYGGATPAQRGRLRQCVIEVLASDCRRMGLDPELFLAHLGPECRAVWAEADRA